MRWLTSWGSSLDQSCGRSRHKFLRMMPGCWLGQIAAPVPTGLTIVGPTVGRRTELARLLAAYDRAAAGAVERILMTGAHGIGKTRLLAELAQEAQARGALVQDHITEERPSVPVVVLLDDLHRRSAAEFVALTELVLSARPPMLVVGAAVLDQAGERRDDLHDLSRPAVGAPLRSDDAEIVRLYVSPDEVEDGVAVAAGAAGVPLQVHAVASRYGEERAAAQVEEAAAGIPGPRRHASESQERVAKKASETGNAYGCCGRRTNPLRHRPSCAPTRG